MKYRKTNKYCKKFSRKYKNQEENKKMKIQAGAELCQAQLSLAS